MARAQPRTATPRGHPAPGAHRALGLRDPGRPEPRALMMLDTRPEGSQAPGRPPSPGAPYIFAPLCCCPKIGTPVPLSLTPSQWSKFLLPLSLPGVFCSAGSRKPGLGIKFTRGARSPRPVFQRPLLERASPTPRWWGGRWRWWQPGRRVLLAVWGVSPQTPPRPTVLAIQTALGHPSPALGPSL